MKKVIVVGGDGFIGWPLSLRLSNLGYTVLIIDNLSRRKIDEELGSNSLSNIETIENRLKTWRELTNNDIKFENVNVSSDYERLVTVIKDFSPNTIIHLGEQRSAPYSMKNTKTRQYTVNNNLNGTHNILNAIIEVDKTIHLVHLGTMGVYGYGTVPNTVIPEGYINVKIKNIHNEEHETEILHPTYPGSVYHMTKSQDAIFFHFFSKNYKIKITDLHQGIVWGINTKETLLHNNLINRFDYDSDYGTVLNRFIMQSACNIPLTIYGTGQQTRAFIHIENSMDCIVIAIENPSTTLGKVKIFNQVTETHRLSDLAHLIKSIYDDTEITYIENPRIELVSNDLIVKNQQFLDKGLSPISLSKDEIGNIYEFIKKHKDNIKPELVMPLSKW
jgi:UDP-sulfoquinovose synthase